MHNILNTLYVMTPQVYAHLENATARIDVEREKRLQAPLHHLSGLVTFSNVMVSPALMHRLADEGKSLVLLDEHGRFKVRMEGPVSGNILLRQSQHKVANEPAATLELARACVAGKLKNSRVNLQRGAREAADSEDGVQLTRSADNLAASLRAVVVATTLDELRGVEGEAARGYFSALISFLYAMLMNDCRSALKAVVLDPQLGFLHAVRPWHWIFRRSFDPFWLTDSRLR